MWVILTACFFLFIWDKCFSLFTSYLAVFGSSLKTIYLLIITKFMAMLLAFLILLQRRLNLCKILIRVYHEGVFTLYKYELYFEPIKGETQWNSPT